jgi:hypothetical protein
MKISGSTMARGKWLATILTLFVLAVAAFSLAADTTTVSTAGPAATLGETKPLHVPALIAPTPTRRQNGAAVEIIRNVASSHCDNYTGRCSRPDGECAPFLTATMNDLYWEISLDALHRSSCAGTEVKVHAGVQDPAAPVTYPFNHLLLDNLTTFPSTQRLRVCDVDNYFLWVQTDDAAFDPHGHTPTLLRAPDGFCSPPTVCVATADYEPWEVTETRLDGSYIISRHGIVTRGSSCSTSSLWQVQLTLLFRLQQRWLPPSPFTSIGGHDAQCLPDGTISPAHVFIGTNIGWVEINPDADHTDARIVHDGLAATDADCAALR